MKKQIEVRLFGLNELGVKEMNEFYKHNIEKGYFDPFKIGDDFGKRKKRFKQLNSFSLDSHIMIYDVKQYNPDEPSRGLGWFELQVKHFKHEIYEVEVIEHFTRIEM